MTRAEERCREKKAYETREAARFFGYCDALYPYRCAECRKYHLTKRRPKQRLRQIAVAIALCVAASLSAYSQQSCPDGSVCVRQSTIDAATKAAVELAEARDVIAKFTAERAITQQERESAARLIDRLNSVIAVQDKLNKEYETVIALYKSVVQMQAEIIERLGKQINMPKSPWQKLVGALKTLATFAAGIALGRGF